MGRNVKLGLVQVLDDSPNDYAGRLAELETQARACFEEGAELVFFPEAFQHVPDRDVIYRTAECREKYAAWKARCAALAKEYGAYLVPWDYEIDADGRIYNCSYVLDRNGVEVGHFRKVHLTYAEIRRGLSHGSDFPVFDLDFGRVGIMICFDNYFPESARILGNRGAELIVYPLYGDTLYPQWELRLRARAVDSCAYVAPCEIGSGPAWTGLVGPEGEILRRLDRVPGHSVVEADLRRRVITNTPAVPGNREDLRMYLARCRRPDAYGGVLEKNDPASWDEIFFSNPLPFRGPETAPAEDD